MSEILEMIEEIYGSGAALAVADLLRERGGDNNE